MDKHDANTINGGDEIKYAGFWRRLLATSIDGCIMTLFGVGLYFALGANPFSADSEKSAQLLSNLLYLILSAAYSIFFWINHDGATPGKKMLAIKVIRVDDKPISVSTAIIRELGYYVSIVPIGLGYLWVGWDKKKQGWHDKLAGTVVVETEAKPRKGLAVLLTMIFFGTFMVVGVVSGIIVGLSEKGVKLEDFAEIEENASISQSLKENQDNISPKARIHYDKSQELFKQMRESKLSEFEQKRLGDETIKEAKLAVEIDQSNPYLWMNLGDAHTWLSNVGTLEDGLGAYQKAEELAPTIHVYINRVGDQLILMGRDGEAVLQFQKTLRLTDKSGFAYLSLGKAYKNLKINEEARTSFEKAIEIFKGENNNGEYDNEILQAQKELAGL